MANPNLQLIEELSKLANAHNLSEIEYEQDGLKIKVARQTTCINVQQPVVSAPAISQPKISKKVEESVEDNKIDEKNTITSPMVGVIYTSPEAGRPAYVKVGDKVNVDQTLFLVEAMKTFNPIKATKSGTVKQILVEDHSPVEFGQPLLVLE